MRTITRFGIVTAIGSSVAGMLALGTTRPDTRPPQLNLEGTYQLVSRDLPDGTVQRPPTVIGLITFTREYRNFNVYWTGEGGKRTSISAISKYSLESDTYRETNVYYMVNDEIGGKSITYDLSSDSGRASVTRTESGAEFQLPLHGEPKLTFTDKGFTATREGEFVDHWERIK